jgi:hypothetical protein
VGPHLHDHLGDVYDVPVSTPHRRSALPGLLAAAVLSAGCAVPAARRYEPPVAQALPEQDPASRGTVQGQHLPISDVEQVQVRLGSDAFGNVEVRKVVSPALTPEQEEEVRRAFARGDWKRQNPLPPVEGTWPETIVPSR